MNLSYYRPVDRKLKVIVNAIPATNPVTGIGRYVLELYAAIAEIGGADVELKYFDGATVSSEPPKPPANLAGFSRLGRIYWSLPLAVSLPPTGGRIEVAKGCG